MSLFAYVDPGLGLLAWQAVVAFFLGLLFYIRKTRNLIVEGLRKLFRVQKREQPAPVVPPPPTQAGR
jgi:hypothetical protein